MTTTNNQPEAPEKMAMRWCPSCGRDDRVQRFKDSHYSRGEICRGVPIEIEYIRARVPSGVQVDAESFVAAWVAALQDESHVTDEDAEDLTLRLIAYVSERTAASGVVGTGDALLPVIHKAAKEPCRTFSKGCASYQPDESYWCAPCSARKALNTAAAPIVAPQDEQARSLAVEILEWLNFDTSLDAVAADIYGVQAIIQKHYFASRSSDFDVSPDMGVKG